MKVAIYARKSTESLTAVRIEQWREMRVHALLALVYWTTQLAPLFANVSFGSLAAGPHRRPSTSAFEHKADIPADEIISLGTAATGQKQTVTT